MTLHATAVAVGVDGDRRAVLLIGPSGSGKSDLALRLIDRGAVLIADDRVALRRDGDRLLAAPPPAIAGLIEIRGVGIVAVSFVADIPVALLVDLALAPVRLPDAATRDIDGVAVPVIGLDAREASAAIKVEWALVATRTDGR